MCGESGRQESPYSSTPPGKSPGCHTVSGGNTGRERDTCWGRSPAPRWGGSEFAEGKGGEGPTVRIQVFLKVNDTSGLRRICLGRPTPPCPSLCVDGDGFHKGLHRVVCPCFCRLTFFFSHLSLPAPPGKSSCWPTLHPSGCKSLSSSSFRPSLSHRPFRGLHSSSAWWDEGVWERRERLEIALG